MANGHRQRLRVRFQEENIDTIPEYIVAERILHGVISQTDTCDTGRSLIKNFGSLANAIDAPLSKLTKIHGIGRVSAKFFKLIPLFYKKYILSKEAKAPVFADSCDVVNFLLERFRDCNDEIIVLLCLDPNGTLLRCKQVCDGPLLDSDDTIRSIVELAINVNAVRVITASNQKDGFPSTFRNRTAVRTLYNTLELSGIHLDDHFIISDRGCESLCERNMIPKIEYLKP